MRAIQARTRFLCTLGTAGLIATLGCGHAVAGNDASSAAVDFQQGYSLGYALGSQIAPTIDDIDAAALVQGFGDAAQQRGAALGAEEMASAIGAFEARRAEAAREELAALAKSNAEAGDAYRAKFAQEPGVTTLDNGLQYRVIEPGAGDPPGKDESVTVHYRGSLVDGTALDDSYSHGEPITVSLDRVLPGWGAALELMPQGAKWQVVIPPSLAYGETGASGFVEPNATLIFEFERVAS